MLLKLLKHTSEWNQLQLFFVCLLNFVIMDKCLNIPINYGKNDFAFYLFCQMNWPAILKFTLWTEWIVFNNIQCVNMLTYSFFCEFSFLLSRRSYENSLKYVCLFFFHSGPCSHFLKSSAMSTLHGHFEACVVVPGFVCSRLLPLTCACVLPCLLQ